MNDVISKEVAEEEVTKWLDDLDVSQETRDGHFIAPVIKDIVKAVQRGLLVINEDGTVTQTLTTPLAGGATKEIKYSSRYKIGDWHKKVRGIPKDDSIGIMLAKLSLLSGEVVAVFEKLDNKDYGIATNIAVFF